jgi:hypothetical protein
MIYVPGAAAVTGVMMDRFKRADVVFFDGTDQDRDADQDRTSDGTHAR